MGQAYARMGTHDPRLNSHGEVDMRLTSLYRAWKRDDEPPKRVKPLPLTVVSQVNSAAQHESTASALAAADCLVLGFYFLLRPGEYLGVPPQGRPGPLFRLGDVQFWIGSRALSTLTCPIADLLGATFVTLTFTEQKNGVRNETVGHGRSGHPHLCPVLCLAVRVVALRAANATTDTPSTPTGMPAPPVSVMFLLPISRLVYGWPWPSTPTPPTKSKTSLFDQRALAAPWHSSAPALTAIAFGCLVDGAPTKCIGTSSSKLNLS